MLIKALWFFGFLQMLSKNESLSADLKPGQRGLGPGKVRTGCQNHLGRPQQFPCQTPGSPRCPSSWWSDAGGCQCKEPWTEMHSSLAIGRMTTTYSEFNSVRSGPNWFHLLILAFWVRDTKQGSKTGNKNRSLKQNRKVIVEFSVSGILCEERILLRSWRQQISRAQSLRAPPPQIPPSWLDKVYSVFTV